MKKISDILFYIYIIISILVLILLNLCNLHCDTISFSYFYRTFLVFSFFFIIWPLLILTGIFARINSYKMIWVKLIPLFMMIGLMMVGIYRTEVGVLILMPLAVLSIIILTILSLTSTFIYRRILKNKQKLQSKKD